MFQKCWTEHNYHEAGRNILTWFRNETGFGRQDNIRKKLLTYPSERYILNITNNIFARGACWLRVFVRINPHYLNRIIPA